MYKPCLCDMYAFAARAGNGEPKRRHTLAKYYDEVCRRQWSQSSFRGTLHVCCLGHGHHLFSVSVAAGDAEHVEYKVQEDLLTRAKDLYDASERDAKKPAPATETSSQKGNGKGKLLTFAGMSMCCMCWLFAHRQEAIRGEDS